MPELVRVDEVQKEAIRLVMVLGSVEHAKLHLQACIITVRTLARRDLIKSSDAVLVENEYDRILVNISAMSDGKRV